jgi:hypothetical protein
MAYGIEPVIGLYGVRYILYMLKAHAYYFEVLVGMHI